MNNMIPAAAQLLGSSPAELQRVIQTLRSVIDPMVDENIVELGLIETLRVTEDAIELTLATTNADCPLSDLVADGIFRALQRTLPERDIYVCHAADINWTPERMSRAARERLCWVAC
jgi:metal-sulfur cluster biosynthetic enzyme